MGIKERKEREQERRRQQLIVAAKRVFAKKNFNQARMEDIAKEAEVSPGTIYLYFKNKDELFVSLSLRILQFLCIRVRHVEREEGADALVKLDKLIEAMYDVYDFDPINFSNIFHLKSNDILKNLSPKMVIEIKKLLKKSMKSITGIFKEGVEKGVIVDRPPVVLAEIFWSLFSGIVLWESNKIRIDVNKDDLKQTLGIAFKIFQKGVITGEGS
jgi:AcrR family transcriptional regulator